MGQRTRTDRLQSQYQLIRDCLAGADAVKDQGQLYVPQPDGMTTQNYDAYLQRGHFSGAPQSTLRALVGLALRKAPVIRLPARLEPLRLSATHDAAPLDILIEDAVREVTCMGKFGMLLDFPADGNSATSIPHIATFNAEAIEDYDTAYVGGKKVLTRVHLSSDEKSDGSDVKYELLLEDTVYKFRRFIYDENTTRVDVGDEVIPTVNGSTLNFIPFVMVSHEGIRAEDHTPPFLSLCKTAIAYLTTSCDRRHSLHLTASPTPWIAGNVPADKVPQTIGSGTLWSLPENCQVGMLEPQGLGLSSMKEELQDLLAEMTSQGARMLSTSINRNETIETAQHRTRSELSLLHGVVVSVEAGLNQLLGIAADWTGAPREDVSITLSRDFIDSTMDAKQIAAQLSLWTSGVISRATFYENLQRGEIARADRTWEDERDMIDEEGGDLSAPVIALGQA